MANTKSAIKAARKAISRTVRNKTIKSRLKTLAKKVQKASKDGKPEESKAAAKEFASALDKAAKSNVISKNSASRHKSQMTKLIFAK